MKTLIRFIRIYTPFICTLAALLNGVFFLEGATDETFTYYLSAITGNSILVIGYFFSASTKMCIWYKLNLVCLALVQIIGLLYDCMDMSFTAYLLGVVLLSSLGIIFFLIFRIFYVFTDALGCTHRYSRKSK